MNKLIFAAIFLSVFLGSAVNAEDISTDTVKLKINNSTFDVKLENNSATEELINHLTLLCKNSPASLSLR